MVSPHSIIDRTKPIPAYYQIEELIQEKIESNEWPVGKLIPTEKEICELYKVSRSVVRQAIGNLVNQGLIYRIPGKGSFVAPPKLTEKNAESLIGFFEDMTAKGLVPQTEILKQEVIEIRGKITRLLNLNNGDKVILIVRLRGTVGGEKITLSTTYIPYTLAPFLATEDLTKQSLYELLDAHGVHISYADKTIEAVKADKESAELLGVDPEDPFLMMTNVSYLEDGTPCEYYVAKHSGVRSKLMVRLARENRL